MNAEIITVGTELLLGDILNTNCQFLSQQLAVMGIGLHYQSTVGDNADRLLATLSAAMERSDIVIITGGLGPTQDDITRETLCKLLHLPADMHEPSRQRIEEFFRLRGTEPTENNYKQACLPRGCTVFPNDHGTAPGCAVERYGQAFILLPGPPRELEPMFHESVAPYLSRFSGGTIYSRTVGIFGLSESAVDERLTDLMQGENPTVAPYCRDGEVVLRITAKAADADTARALCEPIVKQICERIGTYVYGVDCGSLQKAVVGALKEKGKKIATAESCTAGMLSQSLTQIPGVSSVFGCGVTAYSAQTKAEVLGVPQTVLDEQGTVCADVAAAMADGVRRLGEADIGVSITGEAGPEAAEDKPVGTVFIALADAQRVWVKQLALGGHDREYIRRLATLHTLNLTRQYLEALPHVMAGGVPLAERPAEVPTAPAAPPESSPKKHTWLKVLCWITAAALLLALLLHIPSCLSSRPASNAALYQSLYELYTGESAPPTGEHNFPQGMLPRFYSLYNRNADIGGWLRIPDTAINYPVMRDAGSDYYATHSYDKQPSDYGVPYFDAACAADGSGRTLVLYGNNTNDGQMFSDLLKYRDLAFLKAHATVTLSTLYSEADWAIFAVCAFDTAKEDAPDYTRTFFVSDTDFERFIEAIGRYSLYDTAALPDADDTLLFLSVDASDVYGTDGARLVVAARRLGAGESADTAFTEKAQPLLPSATETARPSTTVSSLPGAPDTQAPDTQPESELPTEEPWEPPTEQDWLNPDDPLFTEEPTTTTPGTSTGTTTGQTTQTTVMTVTTTTVTTTATTTTTTTTTAAPTTTVTVPTTTVTTTDTTAPPTVTTTTTTVTTTTTAPPTTTPPTTAPTTKPQPTPATDYVEPGTIPESQFMALFRLKDTRTGKVFAPQTKEELQLALTYIVKYECGYSKIAVNSTAAWEAQAIAAYSYVLNYCKNGGTYSLPLKTVNLNDANDRKIYEAVGKVVGYKILNIKGGSLKNMLCSTMYANNSCGVTASCQYVYTQALPFLQSVPSVYDTDEYIYKYTGNKTLHSSTTTITLDEFIAAAEAWLDAKISKSAVLGYDTKEGAMPLYATSWDGGEGGYVINTNFYYTLNGKKTYIMGKHIRVIINNYSDSNLRSHSFTVTDYDSGTGKMTLSVKGYGHGLGLSQMGAAGYANEAGWSAAQIINHYYSLGADKDYRLVAPVWE